MTKKDLLKQYSPWSPSKATLAATCPLAFKFRYVDHIKVPKKNATGIIGVVVHRAQELVLANTHDVSSALSQALEENTDPLTEEDVRKIHGFAVGLSAFKQRIDKFCAAYEVDKILLEKKWAILPDFAPCEFDNPDSVIRGVLDLAVLLKSGQVIVIDHKTGRRRPASYYKPQLDIYTVFALSHLPRTYSVQCALHYVAHQSLEWSTPTYRQQIEQLLRPWLLIYLRRRAERADTQTANPGKHCKWCDFNEICDHAYREPRDAEIGTSDG